MLAAAAAHHFLGDDVADETASPADFSMEQSENMPEERQRRFWVRFFIGHPTTFEIICISFS